VTLFQFGRTITCTCGARVGREAGLRPSVRKGEPRFVCDAMLGRLARWLRVLGYDTLYDAGIEDAELVRRAVEGARFALTRDRRLPEEWRIDGCLVIEAEEPLAQLREVDEWVGLDWPRELFRRCLECNSPLDPAPSRVVSDRAPEAVRERHDEFWFCPSCERIYWPGSHARRMRRRLERVFEPR
jgi:uncharacterized protein with PIN domain